MSKQEVLLHYKKIFRFELTDKHLDFVAPPKQIFTNDEFSIILVGGGNIVDTKSDEYQNLMNVLQTIGESEYFLSLPTDSPDGFEYISISTQSSVNDIERAFEHFFGIDFPLDNMYMFGKTGKWGIYIDDGIMMNIINCEPQYAELFINAQKIQPDEFESNINLVKQGFEIRALYTNRDNESPEIYLKEFLANYVDTPRNYFRK